MPDHHRQREEDLAADVRLRRRQGVRRRRRDQRRGGRERGVRLSRCADRAARRRRGAGALQPRAGAGDGAAGRGHRRRRAASWRGSEPCPSKSSCRASIWTWSAASSPLGSPQDGDSVVKGQPLFEIETDKAAMEVESPASGVLRRAGAETGAGAARGVSDRPDLRAGRGCNAGAGARPRLRATPKARRLAREAGVDLASLKGGGPQGRVQARDVPTASPTRGGAGAAPRVAGARASGAAGADPRLRRRSQRVAAVARPSAAGSRRAGAGPAWPRPLAARTSRSRSSASRRASPRRSLKKGSASPISSPIRSARRRLRRWRR